MRDFNTNTVNDDQWLTPPWIIEALGPFDLDPCAPVNRPWNTAKEHYTKLDDGLSKPWHGRVWLNPPYGGQTFKWIARLAEHRNGIALIFARTETKGFHNYVWNKADSIFFFRGRLSFYKVTGEKGGPANAPSCLISYSPMNTDIIRKTMLDKGRLLWI